MRPDVVVSDFSLGHHGIYASQDVSILSSKRNRDLPSSGRILSVSSLIVVRMARTVVLSARLESATSSGVGFDRTKANAKITTKTEMRRAEIIGVLWRKDLGLVR